MTIQASLLRALLLAGALPLGLAAQRDGDRIDTTVELARGGLVQLSSVAGQIKVTGEDRSDVRIRAEIERGQLETSYTRSRIAITTRSVGGRQSGARMDVSVPRGTRVIVRTVSGRVEIFDTEGEVTANTTSGSIDVRGAREQVELTSVSASIELERASGTISLRTTSGSLKAEEVSGRMEAETVSGTISIEDGRLEGLVADAVSGRISYSGTLAQSGSYRLNTHSGGVSLTLPSDVGASLSLQTFSGRISSEFPLTMQPGETGGRRGRRMEFTLGGGGARVTAGAFSGSINIRRGPAAGDRE